MNLFGGYRVALEDHHHPLWRQPKDLYPDTFDQSEWRAQAGPRLRLVTASADTRSNAEDPGLAIYALKLLWLDALVDLASVEPRISLDRLLFLLLLLRDLQARNADDDARIWLRSRLDQNARAFATTLDYQSERLHTWKCLIETRMLRWNPDDKPSDKELALA